MIKDWGLKLHFSGKKSPSVDKRRKHEHRLKKQHCTTTTYFLTVYFSFIIRENISRMMTHPMKQTDVSGKLSSGVAGVLTANVSLKSVSIQDRRPNCKKILHSAFFSIVTQVVTPQTYVWLTAYECKLSPRGEKLFWG